MSNRKSRLLVLLICFLFSACAPHLDLANGSPLTLASFSENGVSVSIELSKAADGQAWLSATYAPEQKGFHLYSSSLARNGVGGEGRPTLLELPADSSLKISGKMHESAEAEVTDMGPDDILVYPAGPVTLSLPVVLPDGKGWVRQQLSVTYEACSEMSCLPPVIGKVVPVRIPNAGLVN